MSCTLCHVPQLVMSWRTTFIINIYSLQSPAQSPLTWSPWHSKSQPAQTRQHNWEGGTLAELPVVLETHSTSLLGTSGFYSVHIAHRQKRLVSQPPDLPGTGHLMSQPSLDQLSPLQSIIPKSPLFNECRVALCAVIYLSMWKCTYQLLNFCYIK